jgi:hypothetical protein
MRKNAPGDPGQFVGQRDREHVVVQPLPGGLNPGFEPVALPAVRLNQHHPRRLHEQNPQVAVTPLRYLAENGAVPGRDLPGNEAPARRRSRGLWRTNRPRRSPLPPHWR